MQINFINSGIGAFENEHGYPVEIGFHFDAQRGVLGVGVDIDAVYACFGYCFCAIGARKICDVYFCFVCWSGRAAERCGFCVNCCACIAEFFVAAYCVKERCRPVVVAGDAGVGVITQAKQGSYFVGMMGALLFCYSGVVYTIKVVCVHEGVGFW